MAELYAKADFAFISAIWAPYADKEALRTLTDWQYWVCFDCSPDSVDCFHPNLKIINEYRRYLYLMTVSRRLSLAMQEWSLTVLRV